MVIRLEGPRTQVFVNDVKVTDYTEGQPVPPKKLPFEPDRGLRPTKAGSACRITATMTSSTSRPIAVLVLGTEQNWQISEPSVCGIAAEHSQI